MRAFELTRKTNETDITLTLNLDGTGVYQNATGCGFLDHMLDLFARHGRFDLAVRCQGDTYVDYHHTVEDIRRYGQFILPMDEALILCAVDISGRTYLNYDVSIPAQKIGDFDTELAQEFMAAFTRSMGITLHIKQLAGSNSHHIIEAMFKALARALKEAVEIDRKYANEIPSTKGTIV